MIKEENLHYIAGFFEGEGSAGVYRKERGEVVEEVSITQKNPIVLYWIAEIMSEALIHGHVEKPWKEGAVYRLRFSCINARMFAKLLYPYLRYQHDKLLPLINR